MKLRPLLFSLLILFSGFPDLRAQTTYNQNFHKNYYLIRVADGSNRVFDQRSSNDVWCNTQHSGTNQQWLIMPLYIRSSNGVLQASDDYLIASRSDGDVLDIKSNNTTWCNSDFHSGDNQIFRLNAVPNQSTRFRISSPKNISYVLDKSNNNNNYVYFRQQHDGTNQQFTLVQSAAFPYSHPQLRNIVRSTIPAPPNPTSLNAPIPTETSKVFLSETLIPYPLVTNDVSRSMQAQYYPYYRLVRSQYWKLPDDTDADEVYPANFTIKSTITTRVGMTSSTVTEVTNKINVSFSGSGEVTPKSQVFTSVKLGIAISKSKEMTVKTVQSYSETYETITQIDQQYTTTAPTRITTYQLIDHYQLYRPDGSIVMSWDVKRNSAYRIVYTEAGGGTGGRVGSSVSGTSFEIPNGAPIVSAYSSEALEPAGASLNVEVSPNPTSGLVKVQCDGINGDEEVAVVVYSQAGEVSHTSKFPARQGYATVDISSLPPGIYIVKASAGEKSTTVRVVKK